MGAPTAASPSPQPHRADLSDLEGHLRRGSKRVTGQRQAVLRVLGQEARPMTAREILRAMPTGGCDLATVYRSLHMLTGMGLVCRVQFGAGPGRFELADHPGDPCHHHHHHHLICVHCDDVVELDDCGIEGFESRVAAHYGFVSVTHRLEFYGVCPGCQQASRVRPS